ncbi:putative sodium-coupled neutral amino acid transporter 10 isoform X2 [Carcharodon carcharias]|uniref:putative sodium-coupled neutral amino acid transporter 10 isoform X2 n=1 Tax=Carcharodon carcharias TaxID=13397 RepID=UPI001B7F4EC8|nr:putative sodium-coupled neutral amino acid transporter 10 isoform X2 [Carcharodon carcharias]
MPGKELRLTVTVVNSFVGVSLLALPFCFQQCGIILGSLLLICCSWLAYSSSLMLLEAAIAAKRKTYFGLAQMSNGTFGKLVVEISMIGLMLGTCTAFFAVLQDLGANLFLALTGSPTTPWQRALLLFTITSIVILPLSLEKTVLDSAWQSLISLIFYMLLMIVLLVYCLKSMLSGDLKMEKVLLWQWSGIATSLPIFATSFCCHPLVLPIYFNLRGQSLERMNVVCKQATIITFTFYTVIGLSGYLPLPEAVPGDILAALPPSFETHGIRAIFLISLTSSFPLIILPCRQAISTLLIEQQKEDGTFSVSGDMPFHQHVTATVLLVYCTMIMGVLVPNVETVLGIMGTTMGSFICFICPSVIHARLRKDTFTGRVVLGMGVLLLLIRASSIANLNRENFHLQPVRKSIVVDESGTAELTYRNKDVPTPPTGLVSPELISNAGDKQFKQEGGWLIYMPGGTGASTVVSKEAASSKEVVQLREAGSSTEERLKEWEETERRKVITPLSEIQQKAKTSNPPTGRTHRLKWSPNVTVSTYTLKRKRQIKT